MTFSTSRLTSFFVFLLMVAGTHAQIVINEINYNPPEGGNDSLEYIELYNTGLTPVNIGGWYFESGVEDTLPDVEIPATGYFVTAISASAMMNVFGVSAHEWSNGALNNSGELLILVTSTGAFVDSVRFRDVDPWPTEPDGSGPSLELKSPELDNTDGANWQASGAGTGVIINGNEVKGTPGLINSGGGTGGPDLTIVVQNLEFLPQHAVIALGETVRWTSNDIVQHNVNGSEIAYPLNPEGFYSGPPESGPWSFDYTPGLAGLYNYHCDPHLHSGMTGTLSVYDPLTYTDFPLTHLRLTNENGQHIFDGVPTRVEGVVHGINFQPTGYSFYVIDENNVGINVFSFDPGAYTVTEGDRVRVSGVIDQFNGLLEIIPDDIEVLSQGQNLVQAENILVPDESTEGSHINLFPFTIDSIIATGTSGYNVFAKNEQGTDVLIRIDADSGIDTTGMRAASGVIGVRGIGTQFDSSFPFTSGYQILALQFDVLPGFPVLPEDAISMFPNPVTNVVHLQGEARMESVEVYSIEGKKMLSQMVDSENVNVDLTSLTTGLYLVRVWTPEGVWMNKIHKADFR